MPERLIDANALLGFIDVGHLRSPTEICFSELDMKHIIDKAPTVDAVRVVHGRWNHLYCDTQIGNIYACSVCGFQVEESEFGSPYCAGCGAKMDEEEK